MTGPTDAQWLALMETTTPDSRIVAETPSGAVVARRPDGTGVVVDPDGAVREYDERGEPAS